MCARSSFRFFFLKPPCITTLVSVSHTLQPSNPPIEAGGCTSQGDRHTLILDKDNCILYELYRLSPIPAALQPLAGVAATADSGAIFHMNSLASRPLGWTSADAAGLPVFTGLVNYEETVARQSIGHALRFTVSKTQRAYVAPATHFASTDTQASLLPMGARLRLRAQHDCNQHSALEVRVVCVALKKYGMILADNGGNFFISGAPDTRWNDAAVNSLKSISAAEFEVVDTGAKLCTTADCT